MVLSQITMTTMVICSLEWTALNQNIGILASYHRPSWPNDGCIYNLLYFLICNTSLHSQLYRYIRIAIHITCMLCLYSNEHMYFYCTDEENPLLLGLAWSDSYYNSILPDFHGYIFEPAYCIMNICL